MARTRHLPLYSAAYTFTKDIYRIKIKLPKALKYDLGQEAFASAIKMLKCVVMANASARNAPASEKPNRFHNPAKKYLFG